MPKTMVSLKCALCSSAFQKRKAEYDQRVNKGFSDFYCGRRCHSKRASIALTKNRGICAVLNCDRSQARSRMCDPHYRRWKKYGDPLMRTRPIYESDEDRFWAKVDKSGDCWEWTASRDPKYGRFRLNRKLILAHIFSYRLHNGPVPKGKEVCHRCNNPACVRPDHLYAGTHLENMQDAIAAGSFVRTHCKRGHPFTKDNTYIPPNSTSKHCRRCRARRGRDRYLKKQRPRYESSPI